MAPGHGTKDASWLERALASRTEALQEFSAVLARNNEARILVVKGRPGPAEEAGAEPFGGKDGEALEAAFKALGWGEDAWCGALLAPVGHDQMDAPRLAYLIELLDPTIVISVDGVAKRVYDATLSNLDGAAIPWSSGKTADSAGRLHIHIDDFEPSLESSRSKQLAWSQLKAAAKEGVMMRFK